MDKLRSLGTVSQHRLARILESCPPHSSPRQLHIHSDLIKPFERVCGVAWLKKHGVERILRFDPEAAPDGNLNRVYAIPSCLIKLKCVLDQISGSTLNDGAERPSFTVIVVPTLLSVYESLLEEEGLSEEVALKSFRWDFVYADEGVLSMELPFFYRSAYVDGDSALLSAASQSLRTLFRAVGDPRLFVCVGRLSARVVEMYEAICESHGDRPTGDESEFGAFFIMDRDQDYASALLTPAVYSGLLYEIFAVKSGELDLNVQNTRHKRGLLDYELSVCRETETDGDRQKAMKMSLHSDSDPIYAEIRHRHFSSVFQILSAKAKALNVEGASISNAGLSEMKAAIATRLQRVMSVKKCLSSHILACETVVSSLGDKFEDIQIAERSMLSNKNRKANLAYLEENLCADANKYRCLRLLCILSLTQGVTAEEYNSFATKYAHAFGYKYLSAFHNLVNAGLLVPPPPSNAKFQLGIPNVASISEKLPRWQNNFQANANRLKQLPADPDKITVKEPNCPSYVFNGSYVPLVAAVSKIILGGDNVNDVLNKLSAIGDVKIGGPVIDKFKSGIDKLGERLSSLSTSDGVGDLDVACKDLKVVTNHLRSEDLKKSLWPLKPRSLFVFIVGGMTQAEIAACHLVEKMTGGTVVIGSDSIVTGEHLIQSAM